MTKKKKQKLMGEVTELSQIVAEKNPKEFAATSMTLNSAPVAGEELLRKVSGAPHTTIITAATGEELALIVPWSAVAAVVRKRYRRRLELLFSHASQAAVATKAKPTKSVIQKTAS